MLSYAKGKGIAPIQLATNAYFLNSTIARRIIDLEIDFISFSVDANSPRFMKRSGRTRILKEYLQYIGFISHKKIKAQSCLFSSLRGKNR